MEKSTRMNKLASAAFTEMDNLRRRVQAQGMDIINLSIGSPDLPPSPEVMATLERAILNGENYGYALSDGLEVFRQAVAHWYRRRFEVELDPDTEVLSLMGSQDGLSHIFLAYIDPGDVALIPDPGYPVYSSGLALAGGEKYPMPLLAENDFLPDLGSIPVDVAKKAKLMFLNYPNNPVAAVAPISFFAEVVDFAKTFDLIVCHDIAYSELAYDGYRPVSFLQAPGAKEVGVEFHSLSKTFNMAGCRLGMVVGNREVIKDLAVIKSNIDYGVFKAIQLAGVAALESPRTWVENMAAIYARRRDVLVDGLASLGWNIPKPKASMFLWAPLPAGYHSSQSFAEELLWKTGVVVVPGLTFGQRGEGFVRIALVCDEMRLIEAVRRIGENFRFEPQVVG